MYVHLAALTIGFASTTGRKKAGLSRDRLLNCCEEMRAVQRCSTVRSVRWGLGSLLPKLQASQVLVVPAGIEQRVQLGRVTHADPQHPAVAEGVGVH